MAAPGTGDPAWSRIYTDRMAPWRRRTFLAAWIASALVVLAAAGPWAALTVVLAGAGLVALHVWHRTTQAVSVDALGFAVVVTRRRRVVETRRVSWPEVVRTECYEQDLSEGDAVIVHFAVHTIAGRALHVTDQQASFVSLVGEVNRYTPHLPYCWVPRRAARQAQVLHHAGAYCRVARTP